MRQAAPNILLITIDSLRADATGVGRTPFFDSLSRRSYVFTRAIVPSIPTFFCFPSIMTGQPPFSSGYFLGIPKSRSVQTIAQVLSNNGYSTAAFIADNPNLYTIYNYDLGFDYYFDGFDVSKKRFLSWSRFLWDFRKHVPDVLLDVVDYLSAAVKLLRGGVSISYPGQELNVRVKAHIESRRKVPFFCWVHYMDAHLPYATGIPRYFFSGSSVFGRLLRKFQLFAELPKSIRKLKTSSPEATAILRAAYESCVRCVDDALSDLVTWVKTHYPDTVIIITSDHGDEFMEHGHFQHEPYSLYDELIRVPLLIHLPTDRRQAIDRPVSLVSLAKTICELAEIKHHKFVGSNLLGNRVSIIDSMSRTLLGCRSPQVRHGILDTKTPIVGYTEIWSYRGARYKYILDTAWEKEELYDLEKDPFERVNQIARAQRLHIAEISALHSIMNSLRRTHDTR
ncbi:sulfatase [Candidatus Roizmanbacteria bacterium]|nr:sulfatase [Candidatus Roizmanbacteria bacterium]